MLGRLLCALGRHAWRFDGNVGDGRWNSILSCYHCERPGCLAHEDR